MRFRIVLALLKKELLEALRDRRTLFMMLLLPMVLYPFLGTLGSQATITYKKKIKKQKYIIGYYGHPLPKHILALLETKFNLVFLKTEKQSVTTFLAKNKATAIAKVSKRKNYHSNLQLQVNYLSTKPSSRETIRRLRKAFLSFNHDEVLRRLKKHKQPLGILSPVKVRFHDRATKKKKSRHLLATILPLILVMMTIIGAFYPSIDLTAGEKERGTLETLLTAPIYPIEVIAAKYLTVTMIAVTAGLLNLLSLGFTIRQGLSIAGAQKAFQLGLHFSDYLLLFVFLILVACLAAGVMIVVASFARSFKEAQNYVTPSYLACLLPSILAAMPGAEPSVSSAIIPFTNISFAIRLTLQGELTFTFAFLCISSMAAFIILSVTVASKLFGQEGVLFRSDDVPISKLIFGNSKERKILPNLGDASVLAIVHFMCMFFLWIPQQKANPTRGLVFTLWLGFFFVTLGFAKLRKVDFKETFQLNGFHPLVPLAVFGMVVGGFPIYAAIAKKINIWLFPNYLEIVQQMQASFDPKVFGLSTLGFYALLALSPAICEEITFRGFIMSGLKKYMGPWSVMVVSSVLFAAFHFSIYRFVGTFMLGFVMAWLCMRSNSIFPAMMFHFFNNVLGVFIPTSGLETVMDFIRPEANMAWAYIAFFHVFGFSFYCFYELTRAKPPTSDSSSHPNVNSLPEPNPSDVNEDSPSQE